MKKLRVVFPSGAVDMPEINSPDIVALVDGKPAIEVKLTRKRRVKVLPVVDTAEVYDTSVGDDLAMIQRIRDGEWRNVIKEIGSTEYNKLRLLALK